MPARTRQPQQPVPLNPRFADNVLCAWNAATPDVNLKNGRRGYNTGTGLSLANTAKGRAVNFANGLYVAGSGKYALPTAAEGTAVTFIWMGTCTFAGDASPIGFINGSAGRFAVAENGPSGYSHHFLANFSSQQGYWQIAGSQFALQTGLHVVAVTYDGSSPPTSRFFILTAKRWQASQYCAVRCLASGWQFVRCGRQP